MMFEFGTISVVAVLAAFLSSVISVAVAVIAPMFSHAVKIAEFRQAWINEQRKDIADYLGLTGKWVYYYDEHTGTFGVDDAKVLSDLANDAFVIRWRLEMRLNPNSSIEDQAFLDALRELLDPQAMAPTNALSSMVPTWQRKADEVAKQSRLLLKREWEVTKKSLLQSVWEQWRAKKAHLDRTPSSKTS